MKDVASMWQRKAVICNKHVLLRRGILQLMTKPLNS